jgi:putative methionine-R-sulfoxide reductase with GAF domain
MTVEPRTDPLEILDPASWSALDRIGRVLHVKEADLPGTLEAIVVTAVNTIDNARYAGVNLLDHGRFLPQAVAGQPPLTLDALQQKTGTGPCIDSSRDQVTLRVDDVATDTRWPVYAKLATSLGVASMLCVPLWVDDQRLGSVSLYGIEPHGFTGHQHDRAGQGHPDGTSPHHGGRRVRRPDRAFAARQPEAHRRRARTVRKRADHLARPPYPGMRTPARGSEA